MKLSLEDRVFTFKAPIAFGTDSMLWSIFDPGVLPEDFSVRYENAPIETLELLQDEGKVFFHAFPGDGEDTTTTLHWLSESSVVSLSEEYELLAEVDDFPVPSRQLVVAGSEYMCKTPLNGDSTTPSGGLEYYDHMGTIIQLPAMDKLTLSVYHFVDVYQYRENCYREEVPKAERFKSSLAGVLTALYYLVLAVTILLSGACALVSAIQAFRSVDSLMFTTQIYEVALYLLVFVVSFVIIRRRAPGICSEDEDSLALTVRRRLEEDFPAFIIMLKCAE